MREFLAPCGVRYIKDYTNFEKPYSLKSCFLYQDLRYGKSVELKPPYRSDGATGALDIASLSWWVHDKLCDTGRWSDGTRLTNWQCSTVISSILWAEGRYFRAIYWKWSTFLFGGGEARKNGMFSLKGGK